jgi:hypothetical protein
MFVGERGALTPHGVSAITGKNRPMAATSDEWAELAKATSKRRSPGMT